MALIRNGRLSVDEYFPLDAAPEATPPDTGALLISLGQWRSGGTALADRRLGIRLRSDEDPQLIAGDLARFDLVVLEFPRFRDGRAYSQARLLRERYGYRGELRAVGDVLLEQIHYMLRCGFNAFEIDSADPLRDWQTAAADFSVWYQATGDGRVPAWVLRNRSAHL